MYFLLRVPKPRILPWTFFKSRLPLNAALRCYGSEKCAPVDPFQSGHCSGTMQDVVQKIREQIGLELGYHSIPKCRANLLKFQPKREDLPPRSMKDSYTTAFLPLGGDEVVQEHYVNHLGRVRLGRLMEELDMFAVWICHRHVKVPSLPEGVPLPYAFVTLLIDKIEFVNHSNIVIDADIHLSGHVSWTGNSSMEITIYVQQLKPEGLIKITNAIFMMVARNATNTGPAPINPLKPANEHEQRCYEEAAERQQHRRAKHAGSIFRVPPLPAEEILMYETFRRTKGKDVLDLDKRTLMPNCRWMANSSQTTMIHPRPENRNSQNTIFGGYIMRNAVEISFITASIYVSGRPLLECISDIGFFHPVKVNSFLKFTAYVVYTLKNYMQIMTVTQILDANTFEEVTSNAFHLTYSSDKPVEEVLPRSYHETLWYINGRRKLLAVKDLKSEPDPQKKKEPGNKADNATHKLKVRAQHSKK